jgi:hypothetical protein
MDRFEFVFRNKLDWRERRLGLALGLRRARPAAFGHAPAAALRVLRRRIRHEGPGLITARAETGVDPDWSFDLF